MNHPRTILLAALAASTAVLPAHGEDAAPPAIEVVGRRAAGAYYANHADGAKSPLPLNELPQAVRVMTRQSLDDLGALRIDDVLDYAGGVSRQNNFGGLWDNIAIRGLAGDINNGMALLLNGFPSNRGFNAPRDTASVERIEFLKGPAAALYGASEPGGTLNIVSKRPLWHSALALEAMAGSDDFRRTAIDGTGPVAANAAYRLNAAVERRGSFREHVRSARELLAPAFTWRLAPDTRLDYRAEALRQRAPLDRGVAAVNGDPTVLPRSRFLGEAGDGDIKVVNQTHQLVLEHGLAGGWTARAGLAYKEGTLRGYSTEPDAALQADQRTLRRQRRYRDFGSSDVTLQAELAGALRTGAIVHEVLAGLDAYRLDLDMRMLRANSSAAAPYAIDILAPRYFSDTGQAAPAPLPNTDTQEDQRNTALRLQDTVLLGQRWRLLAGLRADRYRQSLRNLRSGALTRQAPTASTPRLGVSYLPGGGWTLFLNGGRSFRPNAGADAASRAFAPERGRALEAGAKWQDAAGDMGGALSLYHIRKRDALTADPASSGFSIAAGEVRSRGMDADLSGRLGRYWRANASLSYIDASVVRDNTLQPGARLLNVPRVNGSVLVMYEARAGAGRYGAGGGVTYSGRRLGEARTIAMARRGEPEFELPGYALVKLAAYWQAAPRVRLSLDVDNLLDKAYYGSSFQRTWVAPGAPRSLTAGLQIKL